VFGLVGVGLLWPGRVSEPLLGMVAATGTAVITLATLEAGVGTGAEDNQVLFLWVSVFSFWFFGLRHALLQLALIGIADAVLLIDQSSSFADGASRWVVTIATFLVTGLIGAWLRRTLEREREESARLAVVAERMRIARDLHDAAGHGVTAVSLQATAGLRSLDEGDDGGRQAGKGLQSAGRAPFGPLAWRRLGRAPAPAAEAMGPGPLHQLHRPAGSRLRHERAWRSSIPSARALIAVPVQFPQQVVHCRSLLRAARNELLILPCSIDDETDRRVRRRVRLRRNGMDRRRPSPRCRRRPCSCP